MKRTNIIFPIFFLVCLFACSEEYKDPSDNSLTGTWVVDSIYTKTAENINKKKSYFIVMRDGIMNFHTEGIYDSSYFFSEENDNIFYRKIRDTSNVVRKYDSIGKTSAGLDTTFHKIDTVRIPMKPLNPDPIKDAASMEPKYYTTYSFVDNKLVFNFYPSEKKANDNQKEEDILKKVFYIRR